LKRIDSINLNEALTEATGKKHYNSVQEMFEAKFSETDSEFAKNLIPDLQNRITDRDKKLAAATQLLKKVYEELDDNSATKTEVRDFVSCLTILGY
jgi:hypothetical protein